MTPEEVLLEAEATTDRVRNLLSTLDAALKEFYLPALQEQLNNTSPIWTLANETQLQRKIRHLKNWAERARTWRRRPWIRSLWLDGDW